MSTPQKFQRRQVLVKHWLQIRYMALVFFSVLVLCAIFWSENYITLRQVLVSDPELLSQLFQFNEVFLVKMLIFLALVLLVSLYVSHRFAGPIYRFEKSADTAALGDLTHRVKLRDGDELKELQDKFNAMLSALQALVLKDRALARHLSERLAAALQRLPQTQDTASAREEIDTLRRELDRLTQSFKA